MTIAIQGGSPDLAPDQTVSAPNERLVAGRFRLIEQLGRGGMGRVYRAHDEVLDRPVAVKLIYDDAVRDRDLRHASALEARAAARLSHPGIVRILDSGFDDGHLYVVMSLAEGRTLSEILREDGALPVDRALDLAIQVADALAAAHQEGVIHCDVKPGNLLVDADWRVRLVDFGIARVTSSTTGLTGELLQGSAQYVAPEQVEGASVDGRTDLYALGTVLYEMLVGKTPFGGGTIASILARRLVNDPPSLRETNPAIPPKVDQVVLKALARDPDQRFQTTAELRDALIAIRQATPMFPVQERSRGQKRQVAPWPRVGSTGSELPRRVWERSRQAMVAGTARAMDWTTRTGRLAREVLPDAMTRAHLLTPTRRPTLRAGVGVAVLIGLLVGASAAKCGVADVSAEAAAVSKPTAITVQQAAPATPTLVAAPLAESAAPITTEPAPPPAPTATSEPAVAEEAPAPPPPPPARPRPPVRAQSVPPPAPAAEPAPAAPPPAAEAEEDDGDKPRNNLSNTPRSDEKTPEERAKAEAKKNEDEKRAEPPKPARAATLAPYIEPSRQQAPAPKPAIAPPKPEPPKPQPQKQETRQQGGNEKEKKKEKD